jgi:alcohol dehydrogenase (cytochrome c)
MDRADRRGRGSAGTAGGTHGAFPPRAAGYGHLVERSGGRLSLVIAAVAAGIVVVTAAVLAWAFLTSEGWPKTVPALSAEELTKEPTDAWLTNGGTLSNQRYSPLDEIDTSNVDRLRGVWMTNLKSGIAAKYSAEAQPLFYDGRLYVPTGEDDVFAVDVDTGRIAWKYDSGISQKINTVCCGWLSRGVALGEGKVFIGQLDGNLVALDQHTGDVAWKTQVGNWRRGYTIAAAPLYYDGLVITGVSGGEFSIRGRVQAYDAGTGKLVWRFHTIPGPGDAVGNESWPQDNGSWRHGGAPVWQTPAVDPELGLLYFSTGNASPDLDGSRRAGDNLFAASIVAVDAKTGRYRWHFQQVRHDIWDYDSPSPIVLFDVEIDGRDRKALAETSKTGWTYVLDRETGKSLLPIDDRDVPQDEIQKTAGTQPIPQYEPFIDHDVTQADVAAIRELANAAAKGKTKPKVVAGRIFTPFRQEVRVIVPGPQGGTNWQPMSYSPDTGNLYICAMRSVSGYTRTGRLLPEGKQGQTADLGSVFTTTGFGAQQGLFGAWNPANGRIVWQKRWKESCYSGTVSTAGGLVFVGRNNGELQAYDAEKGSQLWSFQTGAGANTTPTVFEHDGKQYVAFLAGGNALAATPHGANLWLFSLEGTKGPVRAGSGGVGTGHAGEAGGNQTASAAAGEQVFADNCSGCHGLNGQGANGGPSLVEKRDRQRVIEQVRNGGGGMPAFKGALSEKEIRDVAAYVTQRIATRG